MKKLAVWQWINECLERDIPVALLYVLESSGSSPGRGGFFMAVTADGKMEGSIGGGMMEHKLVEKARANMQWAIGNEQGVEIIKQIHDKAAGKAQSGMICSGEQTVLLYHVAQKDAEAIQQIISCLTNLQSATLVLSPHRISVEKAVHASTASFQYKTKSDWLYQESLGYTNHLYIIGGGHCSLALSKLMNTLDFYIHVFDDRNDLVTMESNDTAHQKKIVNDYNELSSHIPEGQNSYVVIMTFGYRSDDVVIRALLKKPFKYLGVLGSKAKIQKMFAQYRSEGSDEELLQKIHAPVGLSIKSKTPEEIAVSIAAQIIAVKIVEFFEPEAIASIWRSFRQLADSCLSAGRQVRFVILLCIMQPSCFYTNLAFPLL